MTNYSEHFLTNSGGLRLYFRVYGEEEPGLPVVCLPGITRNSRDFHEIAEHMATERPVITMDFRGRGRSDWDPEWQNYQPTTYPGDVLEVLDSRDIERAIFLGTSLGGLVSMILATTHPNRVAGVILNDIGPEIGPEGLERIKGYIGRAGPVADWSEAVAQAKATYGLAWPDLSDDEWLTQAKRGYRENDEGVPVLDMDPMVGEAARTVNTELDDPWVLFAGLEDVPTMVLHGDTSDILTHDIVNRMKEKKPDLVHVVVADRGHVPILDEPDAVAGIDTFLDGLD